MSILGKAAEVCDILQADGFDLPQHDNGGVKTFDPATLMIIVAILRQVYALVKWWKPEWFVAWQMRNVIKSEIRHTPLEGRHEAVEKAVKQSGAMDFSVF